MNFTKSRKVVEVTRNPQKTSYMLVDIDNGLLLLQTDIDLRSSQKSQLKYWGFKKNNKGYERGLNEIENLFPKLIEYFKVEKINYLLSDSSKNFLDKINSRLEEFEDLFLTVKQYKEGKLDRKHKPLVQDLSKISKRPLKKHQLKAAIHLYLSRNGANFSVPGSGKTSVALSVYEKLRSEGYVNTLFVVGPPSCFQPWRNEFEITLGRKPFFQVLAGGDPLSRKSTYFVSKNKKPELYLTTFQTLLRDSKDVETFMKRQGIGVFLVIDEAHYVKKLEGNWASTILGIAKFAKFRCVLTGTPMPKSYTDIYNLFDFLWPNQNLIDNITKIKIQKLEASNEYKEIKEILKSKIGPLFYRVRKSDLKLKPAFFHKPIFLKMNKYEKLIYDLIEQRIINYSKEDYLKNSDLVKRLRRGRIIRLRQCVSYPALLLTAIDSYEENLLNDSSDLVNIIKNYDNYEISAKLEYLLDFVKKRNKEKIIIWSNFVKTIELLQSTFRKNDIKCKSIYGKVPIEERSIKEEETREKIIKEFLDPKSGLNVLIANPAACAESISLHTTCHIAVYYDLSYNCAQYLQSLDRIHRVGGSENLDTHYYFLQYKDSIDEDIFKNLIEKSERMNSLIEEDYNIYNLEMTEENEDEEAFIRLFNNNGKS